MFWYVLTHEVCAATSQVGEGVTEWCCSVKEGYLCGRTPELKCPKWLSQKTRDFSKCIKKKKRYKLFPRERSHQPSCCSKYDLDRFENLSCFIFCCTADNSWISINREGKRITPPENISRGKGFMVEKTQISLELGVWRRELKGKHIFLCTELFTNWIQPVA